MLLETLFTFNLYSSDVTFNNDIKPIFQKNCVECHNGITNYEAAYLNRGKIYDKVVNNKKMPPNFRLKLTSRETKIIKSWIENGAKR